MFGSRDDSPESKPSIHDSESAKNEPHLNHRNVESAQGNGFGISPSR